MRHKLTCKSTFVVYLVTCSRMLHQPPDQNQQNSQNQKVCGRQYVGSTIDTMGTRHNGHRMEIKNKNTPLGKHFSECGIEHFSLQIIDCVKEGEVTALEVLEGFWAHRLATFRAHGHINKRDEMTRMRRN